MCVLPADIWHTEIYNSAWSITNSVWPLATQPSLFEFCRFSMLHQFYAMLSPQILGHSHIITSYWGVICSGTSFYSSSQCSIWPAPDNIRNRNTGLPSSIQIWSILVICAETFKARLELHSPRLCATCCSIYPVVLVHLILYYCLYTPSHIPQLSIFITANRTYVQPGEESLFTEESRSIPRESTCIEESSQSLFPIKCFPSNDLPLYIILQMTNIPDFINESGWRYQLGHRWWWQWERKWAHWRVHVIIRHGSRRFGSPGAGPTSRSGALGQVSRNYKGSIAKETEPCWYCDCTPSPFKFMETTLVNSTATTQTAKVSPPQHIIRV